MYKFKRNAILIKTLDSFFGVAKINGLIFEINNQESASFYKFRREISEKNFSL